MKVPVKQFLMFFLVMASKGGIKYHIKGCAGQGGFAQVYKANVDGDPDDVVALKVMTVLQVIFPLFIEI